MRYKWQETEDMREKEKRPLSLDKNEDEEIYT